MGEGEKQGVLGKSPSFIQKLDFQQGWYNEFMEYKAKLPQEEKVLWKIVELTPPPTVSGWVLVGGR